jgi:capsular exopolysaccharide synthesis family protein
LNNSNKGSSIIDPNEIKSIFNVFVKHWKLIVFSVSLCYVFSVFYTYQLIDIYQASSQILIKSNDTYDVGSTIFQGMSGGTGGYRDYTDNYNAIRVIKSYDLIKATFDKLNLDVSYYIEGKLKTSEVFNNLPFEVEVISCNSTIYEVPINFKYLSNKQYEISYSRNSKIETRKYFFNVPVANPDFKILVKKKSEFNLEFLDKLKDISYLFVIKNKNSLIQKYQSALNCEIPEYTGIIEIKLDDNIEERAVAFLDTLSKVYIDYTLLSKLNINEKTIAFINKQLEELTEIIEEIQDQMQEYKDQQSILNLTKEEEVLYANLLEFEKINKEINYKINGLSLMEKFIIENKNSDDIPPQFLLSSNDMVLSRGLEDLFTLQLKKNEEVTFNTAQSLNAVAIDNQVRYIKQKLLDYIQNSKLDLANEVIKNQKKINEFEKTIGYIPNKKKELLNIQRQLEINQKMYEYLLEKKANTTIARAGIISDSKIIESARSRGVIAPNKSKITFTFLIFGLGFSLLVIFIITLFFEKIETISELKQKTNLPILGEVVLTEINKNQTLSEFLLNQEPKSQLMECFRIVRTNLQYINNNQGPKVFLLTSKNPSEGKTFCSINLGIILAKSNKKVLLLEFDMHKPKISETLNLTSEAGLSTIIIGKTLPSNAVVKTPNENLDLILCGPIPPNASELVLSNNVSEIIKFGKENYDFVIIDTPPIGLITDGVELMRYSDVNIHVLNTKFPYRDSINIITEVALQKNSGNFALILNGVKRKRINKLLGKYGYGYGYGYTYGFNQNKP